MPSPLRLTFVTLSLAAIGLVSPVKAVRQEQPASRVLPDFDIRESRPAPPPSPQTEAEIGRAAQAGSKRPRVHPFTAGVRVLERPGLTIRPTLPAPALRNVVSSLANRLGLEDGDLASLTLLQDYVTRSNGIRTITFAQTVDDVPVFDAVVSIHVDRTGDVVRVTSSAGRSDGRRRGAPVTVAEAVVAAARNIRPELPFAPTPVADASGVARFARGQFRRDLLASLTWLPVDGVLRLAWHITVEPESESELYDVLIDATTGEVLLRRNRVHFAEGSGRIMQSNAMNAFDPRRLDSMPMGQPGTSCPPPSNYQLRSLNTPFRDPSTTLFDTGRLSGNNAHVFRRDPSTEGALGTRNGASWKFDFPFNSDDSAETALFFALNFAHDFFYDLGFDEAAGNFQVDNFNRGGNGGDPVRGNARAVGRNNANYVHAADGSSPQINMFLWDGAECWSEDVDFDGGPDLDGDYDFDIILHEYHHGVSLRLSPAFTGVEAGAMGEGGGDFFAYSVNGNTLLAEYARPGGLRGVNSKTYADWWCRFGLVCEVHDNGEIWANALWDTRERFRIDRVGGTEASGVNEVHQLYIDSLKLAPPSPTMLDMRDTMLLDDALRNPAGARSANFCRLWEAFAGRGMGAAAVDTASHGFNSVVADFTVPEGCVAPPSLPVVTVTVAVPTATEAGPVSGAFRLSRSVTSADPLTIQYSISGTALNGVDYQSVPASATIPAGAADVLVSIVPIDDTALEANEGVSLMLRSGGPYIIGTPSSGSITIVSDDVAADLLVSSVTVPTLGAAGLTIQITDTTINQGSGAAPSSSTSFYLSSNSLLDASDPVVGMRDVPALTPGVSSTGTTSVTLPDPLTPGSYTLFAKADGPGAVTESNEFNNARLAFIQIGPDMTVTSLSVPASAGAGTTIVVSDTTANPGLGEAAASVTRFYLSQDFSWDSNDVLLQGRSVPLLTAGTSSNGTTSVTIPPSTADGVYYLIAKADGTGIVAESNETNNTRSAVLRIGPDLAITATTAPARAAAGASIDVTETTQNIGTGNAGASVTAFYLSTNALLDASDMRLGSRSVQVLGPNATSVRTTSVALPSVSPGTWYLIVNADDERTVTETVETNNARAVSMLVGPDLNVFSFTLPFTVAAGATVSIGDTVKNLGAADAGASVIRFYLSTNTAFDSSDVLIGSRNVPAIAAGAINSGTTSVVIPSGLSGSYYVFAVADATGVVAEASEGNNSFLRLVQINGG
jgi:subtilase family serine protease